MIILFIVSHKVPGTDSGTFVMYLKTACTLPTQNVVIITGLGSGLLFNPF